MSYENDDRARIVRLYYVIGMAFLFTAIKVALTVIIDKLRMQIMMNGLVVFSLNQYKFNPHPPRLRKLQALYPRPHSWWRGRGGKTGDYLGLQPRLPLFFRQINLHLFTESTTK